MGLFGSPIVQRVFERREGDEHARRAALWHGSQDRIDLARRVKPVVRTDGTGTSISPSKPMNRLKGPSDCGSDRISAIQLSCPQSAEKERYTVSRALTSVRASPPPAVIVGRICSANAAPPPTRYHDPLCRYDPDINACIANKKPTLKSQRVACLYDNQFIAHSGD